MSLTPIRVFVCGGHDFQDVVILRRVLDAVQGRTGVAALLEGGDSVGLMAAEWAVERSIPVVTLRRRSREEGDRDARVKRIVLEGKPDFIIGFPGGHRTADLLDRFQRAGIRTYRVPLTNHADEPLAPAAQRA
jgi:hypothetical protein